VLDNYVKPPIHGWAFALLRERLGRALTREQLEQVFDRLSRWTEFWLDARRVPGHLLPHYQHGNDSGWDNSTMFDLDRVVEAPDLAAFLLVQLDVVAGLAGELGHPVDRWSHARDEIERGLLSLWQRDGFVARHPVSGRHSSGSSLLTLMPLVAGDRLPGDLVATMADMLERHLTPWGLATERPDSEHYEDDGYWRGPIWAPSTVLIEDGLRRAGYRDLADEVRSRFLRLCERSGFAENFDARTGAGLRDRAYTWTASAYILLRAREDEDGRSPRSASAIHS
jgi:glycogen debranching enzyme